MSNYQMLNFKLKMRNVRKLWIKLLTLSFSKESITLNLFHNLIAVNINHWLGNWVKDWIDCWRRRENVSFHLFVLLLKLQFLFLKGKNKCLKYLTTDTYKTTMNISHKTSGFGSIKETSSQTSMKQTTSKTSLPS